MKMGPLGSAIRRHRWPRQSNLSAVLDMAARSQGVEKWTESENEDVLAVFQRDWEL